MDLFKKGYGVIELTDGKDLFVHATAIDRDGFKTLSDGDRACLDLNDLV